MLDNALWSGRPVEVDSNPFETLIANSQYYTMWETENMFKISKSSFENHLQQLGYVNCFDVCVPLLQKKETFLTVFLHVILYLCVYAQSLSHV